MHNADVAQTRHAGCVVSAQTVASEGGSDAADERLLQPRRTWARMVASFIVVGLLIASVFFAVPRGVTVGSIHFVPHNWHKKSDHGTYTLQLGVSMPVYNNNWYPATISGEISVLFLDVPAGNDTINDFQVDARSQGQELHQCMDASGVPVDYALTIIQMCMLYPRKLMFTTLAHIRVATWLSKTTLPAIDTYFMVDCFDQTITEVEDPLGCGAVQPPASQPSEAVDA
eukprot:jgi/Ulvmu1/12043/UM083_0056.1